MLDRNSGLKGIFPKSYVHIVADVQVVKNEYRIKRSEIVDEITTILREWHSIFKKFFLVSGLSEANQPIINRRSSLIREQTSNPSLKLIREKMLELIKLRAQMLSGNLPVDEMKDIKLKAASEIDTGNKLLGKVKSNDVLCVGACAAVDSWVEATHRSAAA